MKVEDIVKIKVKGNAVVINIELTEGTEDFLRLLNGYIETTLDFAVRFDIIKRYSNRIDHFFILPQKDWLPAEVVVELKRLLKI